MQLGHVVEVHAGSTGTCFATTLGQTEAELFPVAVEAFVEQPNKLKERDPELYSMLREYFNQDPAALFTGRA